VHLEAKKNRPTIRETLWDFFRVVSREWLNRFVYRELHTNFFCRRVLTLANTILALIRQIFRGTQRAPVARRTGKE